MKKTYIGILVVISIASIAFGQSSSTNSTTSYPRYWEQTSPTTIAPIGGITTLDVPTLDVDSLIVNVSFEANPSTTQNITAGGGITATNPLMRVQGSGGAVTITATPSIADGTDGQLVRLQGDSDTNTLLIQDESVLTGSGVMMRSGNDCNLGKGDMLLLSYDLGDDIWYSASECIDN